MDATVNIAENTKASSQSQLDLPPDLIPEILSRLPVKSLLRFRCVSKPWLALVDSDADFSRSHLNNFKNNRDETLLIVEQASRQNGGCVIRCSDTFEFVSEIPFGISYDSWRVASSLHGLILLTFFNRTIGHFRDLKLWNPSIKRLRNIPPLLKSQVGLSPSSLCFDRDIGLGYDPVAKTYKHVKLICAKSTLYAVAIYELGADSWKIIKFQDKGSPSCSNWHWNVYAFDRAVHFRGSLYFISLVNKFKVWDLVRFDLSKEEFSSVRMPEGHPSGLNWWSPALVSFDGGSSLVVLDTESNDLYTWTLDSESMCWTKLHVYALKEHDLLHMKKNGYMLTCSKCSYALEDEVEEWDEVTSINHETGKCKKTLKTRLDSFIRHVSYYVESLIMHN